ncbi:unnamed protein product [Camellia sinensis]
MDVCIYFLCNVRLSFAAIIVGLKIFSLDFPGKFSQMELTGNTVDVWTQTVNRWLLVAALVAAGQSSGRSSKMWLINLSAGSTLLYSWTICSAGIFVLVALVLSMYLIFEHLAAYYKPEEQKFLIGLILMVPVYALESLSAKGWLGLLIRLAVSVLGGIGSSHKNSFSGNGSKAMYIMPFPVSLVACVQVTKTVSPRIWGGEENTIEFMERQSLSSSSIPLLEEAYAYGVVEHPFPLNCFLRDWHLGSDFYQAVKVGIVQYVIYQDICFQMILKLICALLAMVFEFFGVYGEGKFEWRYAYPYLAVVINFSQTWALYCLVQFYSVTKNKLAPIKPLAKFLTFKSIIFLTWWQGVAVAFLFSMGAFRGALAQELKTRIQDYIICIEGSFLRRLLFWRIMMINYVKQMGVAAVIHFYVFPAVPYKRGERCARNVAVMTDYASLGSPLDPEEIQDSERSTRINLAHHNEREERLSFPQSVRDVVVGSGEIIVDDMKFTVSHVVEPVERGIAKINKTFHQISENVKWLEEQRKNSKDDSYLIPLNSRAKEFSEVDNDDLIRGSVSDSGLSNGKEQRHHTKATASRFIRSR